jgi:hypothetical protein
MMMTLMTELPCRSPNITSEYKAMKTVRDLGEGAAILDHTVEQMR